MTTTKPEPQLSERHFDALEAALSFRSMHPMDRDISLAELPAILRAQEEEIARLTTEKDELLRALKLSGGVARKALEELAAQAPAVDSLALSICNTLFDMTAKREPHIPMAQFKAQLQCAIIDLLTTQEAGR